MSYEPTLDVLSIFLGKLIMAPTQDPRDPVGDNPTDNPRRSSAKKRRQAARRYERDLEGSRWERDKKD